MALAVARFDSRPSLMRACADRLEAALYAGVATRGAACAALSGGTTPEPAYAELALRDLDWPKVTFALVDERFVPPSDPGSNEAMLRRALAPALAKGATLAPLWSEAPSAADAAMRAESAYAALKLDIAIMGMGGDAHTASWFPGSPELAAALDRKGARAVLATTAQGAAGASQRLTLSLPAIASAAQLVLLITGAEKLARLEAAASEAPEAAPVAALLRAGPPLDILWAP